jgi:anti-sigma regulatory factor (Ser/Thr protein kinase)
VNHDSASRLGSRTFPAEPSTPARARPWATDWLTTTIGGRPHRSGLFEDAALVVSELVTNAIRAGSGTTAVSLRLDADTLTISVTDNALGIPQPQAPPPQALSGRGLFIVSALATDWGYHHWGTGKTVWAELTLT